MRLKTVTAHAGRERMMLEQKASDYAIANGRLTLPDRVLDGGGVAVKNGTIVRILEPQVCAAIAGASAQNAEKAFCSIGLPARCQVIDAAGRWVTPGLAEVHIHGAGGTGFEALNAGGRDPLDALIGVRAFLRARGITSFMPTLLADKSAIASLASAIQNGWSSGAFDPECIPGIYVEGPFINMDKRGGIPAPLVRECSRSLLESYLDSGRGLIRRMVYAPELSGADMILAGLEEQGIIPSLGHSDAVMGGFAAPEGNYTITHLFNAMSPVSHKRPGLAMLPFICGKSFGRPYVELVSDGVHVNDYALKMAARCIDPERLMLISDAAPAAGLPDGEYEFCGRRVVSGPRGVRCADNDVLMGSRCLGPELLRHSIEAAEVPVWKAVRALTLNPRAMLGIADRGAIATGMKADLVVWEGDFEKPALIAS